MRSLKDLEKIVCPKCKFVMQRRIGIVRQAGFLWYFHNKKLPDVNADWSYGYHNVPFGYYHKKESPVINPLSMIGSFYCPDCCEILPDTVKIKKILKRYFIMQKLQGHKKKIYP